MPTLTHWIALCGLACSCQAATSASLVARYGLPVMQQFDAAPGIRITVEYGPDRLPIAVRFAPPDYNPHHNFQTPPTSTMDRSVVSELTALLLPDAFQAQMSTSTQCSGRNAKVCTHTETGSGYVISERYPEPEAWQAGPEKDFVLTIASDRGLAFSSATLRTSFGPLAREEFTAGAGIALAAKYGPKGKADELIIEGFQSLRESSILRWVLPALSVNNIVDELVPPYERIGAVRRMTQDAGGFGSSSETYDNVTISRSTVGDDGISNATVRWLAHPPSR